MFYYKSENCYACSDYPLLNMTEITQEEYEAALAEVEEGD